MWKSKSNTLILLQEKEYTAVLQVASSSLLGFLEQLGLSLFPIPLLYLFLRKDMGRAARTRPSWKEGNRRLERTGRHQSFQWISTGSAMDTKNVSNFSFRFGLSREPLDELSIGIELRLDRLRIWKSPNLLNIKCLRGGSTGKFRLSAW